MIVRINGVEIAMKGVGEFGCNEEIRLLNFQESSNPPKRPAVLRATDWALSKLEEPTWKMTVAATAILLLPSPAWAASAAGGWELIHMMQAGAFWVGLAVSIWGVYEWQIGGAGWKDRIMKGFLGYILIMILPMLFLAVQQAFV